MSPCYIQLAKGNQAGESFPEKAFEKFVTFFIISESAHTMVTTVKQFQTSSTCFQPSPFPVSWTTSDARFVIYLLLLVQIYFAVDSSVEWCLLHLLLSHIPMSQSIPVFHRLRCSRNGFIVWAFLIFLSVELCPFQPSTLAMLVISQNSRRDRQ